MSLFAKKSLTLLLQEASSSGHGSLKRTLGAANLVALGIGAIIGAGLFVRTAAAAAQASGPGVTLAFVVAAIGCAFAGLCYAEFAAMIPIAGSAYTYAYTTMGELVAWIIGWALVMEYALGAATVSIAWSEYLNNLLNGAIPYEWCHSPLESTSKLLFASDGSPILNEDGTQKSIHLQGIVNFPAVLILFLLSALLVRGTQESAFVNAIIVFVKVAIVLLFIALGWSYINPENYSPYFIPEGTPSVVDANGKTLIDYTGFFKHGYGGILGGAAIVFFAFIGFDAVSTAAQEAKNPARDMPIGILGSLVVCTVLYILFGHVLTGVANWQEFADPSKGREASVAYAIETYMTEYSWLAKGVSVAILAGFSSVILVMLMGQSRVFFSMSKDGLLPKVFSDVHPKYHTPYKSNIILFVFVGIFAAFVPGSLAGDLTSFGTLFAFVLVCAGVMLLRRSNPEISRPFKTPLVPLVPILGILVCGGMIVALDFYTLLTAFAWMLVGLLIYFGYSRHHSLLRKQA